MHASAQPPAAPRAVRISAAAERTMLAAARTRWPREAVLLLVGESTDGCADITACDELPNAARDTHSFAVDAVAFARIDVELRAAGRRWLGFAHSHPGGAAAPSAVDREQLWSHCVQIVIGMPDRATATLAAFWLSNGRVQPLRVTDYERHTEAVAQR